MVNQKLYKFTSITEAKETCARIPYSKASEELETKMFTRSLPSIKITVHMKNIITNYTYTAQTTESGLDLMVLC